MEKEKEYLNEKIERFKVKAEFFLKNNNKVFIIDLYDNYYFCNLLFVGEDYLTVQGFTGVRKGETNRLLWADVLKIKEYHKKEGNEDEA